MAGFGAIQTARGAAFNFNDSAQSVLLAELLPSIKNGVVGDGDILLELTGAVKTAFDGTGAALTARLVLRDGTTTVNLITVGNLVPTVAGSFYTKQYYAVGGEKVYVDFTPGTTATTGKGSIFLKFVGLGKP